MRVKINTKYSSRPMTNQGCTYRKLKCFNDLFSSRPMTKHGCTYHF